VKGDTVKKATFVATISVMFFLAAPLFAAGDAAAGKEAYLKKCASCHGQSGEGKDAIAQMLKVKLVPLGSKEVQGRSDSDLKKILLEGTGKMKPVKEMNPQMADDILAYVRTLGKK
jgi:mono/diheme cytochrome c family protein